MSGLYSATLATWSRTIRPPQFLSRRARLSLLVLPTLPSNRTEQLEYDDPSSAQMEAERNEPAFEYDGSGGYR